MNKDQEQGRIALWMLESVKEFEEEAFWKTPRERGTLEIFKTKISVIGGALDGAGAGDSSTDGSRRWTKWTAFTENLCRWHGIDLGRQRGTTRSS